MSIIRFALPQQWGHIGSELGRAIHREQANDLRSYRASLERTLNMLDEMIQDHIGKRNLKEIVRFREILAGIYTKTNATDVSLEDLEYYCNQYVLFRA